MYNYLDETANVNTHEHRDLPNQSGNRRQWYVVYTKPQKEEVAQYYLEAKGIEVFHPKLHVPASTKKRRRTIPLFPNYFFVHINLFSDEYQFVTWSRGVKRFVSFNEVPAPVEDRAIQFLKQQTDSTGAIVAKSNLKVGQEVQIEAGPFKGLVGIIQEPPDARDRVKVLMTLLSRQVQVEVPTGFLRSGWVPPYRC